MLYRYLTWRNNKEYGKDESPKAAGWWGGGGATRVGFGLEGAGLLGTKANCLRSEGGLGAGLTGIGGAALTGTGDFPIGSSVNSS